MEHQLPDCDKAQVEENKLYRYLLNPNHTDGTSVRRHLWQEMNFCTSGEEIVHIKMSRQQRLPQQYQLWQDALAWAA